MPLSGITFLVVTLRNANKDIKNPYAAEMMDKAKSLRVESNPSLDPNGEPKSISLVNMTHPSLEEALDEINPRATNPWKSCTIKCSMNIIGMG